MEKREIKDIAMEFAVEITAMCDDIKGRSVFVNQLLRAASSIGANVYEAKYAQSNADFVNKMEIALKECNESEYWLTLLVKTKSISEEIYEKYKYTCGTLRRMLVASIKTVKAKM